MPELSRQRRVLVLVICCFSLFIVGMDRTIRLVSTVSSLLIEVRPRHRGVSQCPKCPIQTATFSV